MAKYSPDEIRQISDKYNEAVASGKPVTAELAQQMKDAATGIKDYTENLKATQKSLKDAALKLGSNLMDGEEGLSIYNDVTSKGLQTLGTFAEKIPIVGGALKGLADAASKAIPIINKQADTLFSNFRDISRSGLVIGMGDTFKNLEAAGYTVKEIKEYGALMKQNSTTLATLGGTAAQGAQQFANVAQSIKNSDLETNFMNMGMTVNDINSGVINYIKIQQLSGSSRVQSNQELKEGAQEFIEQQDRLSKLTGLNSEQQNRVYEHALAQEQFNAKTFQLQQKADAGDQSAKDEIKRNKEILEFAFAEGGQKTADDAALFLAGAVNNPGYLRFQRAFGTAANSITAGVKNAGVIQEQMTTDVTKTLKEQSMLGTVDQYGKTYGALNEQVKMASRSVNKVTENNKTAQKQQDDQKAATDTSVGSMVKMTENQRDTTQSLDHLTNKGVGPVTKAFSGLTAIAQQLTSVGGQAIGKEGQVGGGTTLLQKVGIGGAPAAAAPAAAAPSAAPAAAPSAAAAPAAAAPKAAPSAAPAPAPAPAPAAPSAPSAAAPSAAAPGKPGPSAGIGAKVGAATTAGLEAIKQMIIRHEGLKTKPYQDSLGLWTVGVGHLIGNGKTLPSDMNREFSQQEIMDMFNQDFDKHVKIAERTPGWALANAQGKAAMIDLAFNMGQWWNKFPNTAKAMGAGDWAGASAGLKDSAWYKQVKGRASTVTGMIAGAGEGGPGQLSAARGGVLSGPSSGYSATLHGNEAVVPLPDGKTIPVQFLGDENSGGNDQLIAMKIQKLDLLISGLQKHATTSQKILQRQS